MSRYLDPQHPCPHQQRWTAMLLAPWKRPLSLSIRPSRSVCLKLFGDEDESLFDE